MSAIEWTDATWNPVTGCTKVSPGCAHCYAEGVATRFWPTRYPKIENVEPNRCGTLILTKRPRQFTDVMTHADRLDQPLRWKKPRKVFVNSMSDLFHEDVPDAFIDQVFAVMALAPRHTFQILTKRAERMREYMNAPGRVDRVADVIGFGESPGTHRVPYEHRSDVANHLLGKCIAGKSVSGLPVWPLPNVWLGVSVENQRFADERIPLLLQTPAAVRFISAEPLLGPIDVRPYMPNKLWNDLPSWKEPELEWVIVGGESGPGARPMQLEWAESVVVQCRGARVPVFVKQLGSSWRGISFRVADGINQRITDRKGGDPSEWPEDLRVREFPSVVSR